MTHVIALLGPNTGTGHASIVFSEEVQVSVSAPLESHASHTLSQINYALQLIKPVVRNLASSFELKLEEHNKFNKELQRKLSLSVWSGCVSWYRSGYTGKVVSLWPGTMTEFWWKARTPIWSHYKVVGGGKWSRRQRVGKVLHTLGFIGAIFGLVWVRNNRNVLNPLFTQFVLQVSLIDGNSLRNSR